MPGALVRSDPRVVAFLERARQSPIDVPIPDEALLRHVEAILPKDGEPIAWLEKLHASDVLVAFGAAEGDPSALAEVDAQIGAEVPRALARFSGGPSFVEDVQQQLRQRLLVSEGERPPRIGEYGGRGPLAHWLRASAVRLAINMMAKAPREEPSADEDALRLVAAPDDPELEHLKARYGREFKDAVRTALAGLEPRDRNVLRMYVLDGLNIDRIGSAYGVHRSTVARWIQTTRERILEGTREALAAKLKVEASEFDSLVKLVQSQLGTSLPGYLGRSHEPE